MAYYERMDEAVRYGPVCRRDIRLYSEQEQQIYKYVRLKIWKKNKKRLQKRSLLTNSNR